MLATLSSIDENKPMVLESKMDTIQPMSLKEEFLDLKPPKLPKNNHNVTQSLVTEQFHTLSSLLLYSEKNEIDVLVKAKDPIATQPTPKKIKIVKITQKPHNFIVPRKLPQGEPLQVKQLLKIEKTSEMEETEDP